MFFPPITSHCLIPGHDTCPRPNPGLWSRSQSRHISGPGFGPGFGLGPGPVKYLVPALVPVPIKIYGPVTQCLELVTYN